jgi:hypothetical protein
MALNAAKAGQGITAASWNELMAMQDFQLIYEGSVVDSVTGSGTTENSVASYAYLAAFTLTGVTSISRVELELDKDGTGADVTVIITDDSILSQLIEVVIPKEFIPNPKGYVSIPIGLTGLTSGGTYYIGVLMAGDATNKVDWVGEASTSVGHTCYKVDDGLVEINALHFRVYSGNSGELIHGIYGTNMVETYIYTGEDLTTIWRYCPPSDGAAGGIRDIIDITFDGDYLTEGAVT